MAKISKKQEQAKLKKLYEDLEPEKKEIVDKLTKETGLKKDVVIPFLARAGSFILEILGEALGGIAGIPLKVLSGICKAIAVDSKINYLEEDKSVAEMKLSYCLLEDRFKEYSVSKDYKGENFSGWVKEYLDKTKISEHYKISEATLDVYEKLYQARNLSILPEIEIVELMTSEKTKNIKGIEKIDSKKEEIEKTSKKIEKESKEENVEIIEKDDADS